MAKVIITIEDLPDATLRLALVSEPTMERNKLTPAQLLAVLAYSTMQSEAGFAISQLDPVDLAGSYQVQPIGG